jgi:PKHD-type hydroxylase
MAHTCKLFDTDQINLWIDKANKLGWQEDSNGRFSAIDLSAKEEKVTTYTNHVYSLLNTSNLYSSLVCPRRGSIPIVYQSKEGNKEWGFHRDDTSNETMTREYSIILALNSPEEYDGGEIVVKSHGAEVNFRLPVGMAIITKSSDYIKFRPVTKGNRILCRWSIESYIKDESFFDINLQYNQMYDVLNEGLSGPADELFAVTNNMLLNKVADFSIDDTK